MSKLWDLSRRPIRCEYGFEKDDVVLCKSGREAQLKLLKDDRWHAYYLDDPYEHSNQTILDPKYLTIVRDPERALAKFALLVAGKNRKPSE